MASGDAPSSSSRIVACEGAQRRNRTRPSARSAAPNGMRWRRCVPSADPPQGRRSGIMPLTAVGRLVAGALLYRLPAVGEVERGRDEGDVREGLREIADQPPGLRIIFLGQQPEVVAQPEQPLEQALRLPAMTEQYQVVGQPEAAGQESALAGRQAVGGS